MSENEPTKMNWHSIARTGILVSKISVLLFLLLFIITLTVKNIVSPYSIYLIGIECAIFLMSGLMMLRMSTFKPKTVYDTSKLTTKVDQLSLLLTNITYDIDRFEEGASYYFNGVRVFKYSTMILAGVSTILLGLSLNNLPFSENIKKYYPEVAKNIAFVIGAIITVYSGLMTYWNIEKYWLQNKAVVNKLRALRDEIENEDRAQRLSNEIIQDKFKKYQEVKGEFYKYWEGALSGKNAQNSGE
jgi:putative Mn2+ efflux pump MntP